MAKLFSRRGWAGARTEQFRRPGMPAHVRYSVLDPGALVGLLPRLVEIIRVLVMTAVLIGKQVVSREP